MIAFLLTLIIVAPISLSSASATSELSYDFNTAGSLASGFNSYVSSGTVTQTLTGGISNSGAINAPGSANAVFTSKSSYSIGPVGSTYTFTSFIQSVGNSGYSGMGFTSLIPGSTTTSGTPFRPNDALGISVHGGGFVFHNGATNYSGSWNSSGPAGVTAITTSGMTDLLNNGSADKWYKIILKIEKVSSTTFNMHVEVWPSTNAGVLLHAQASAIFELNGVTNSTLMNSPVIYSYINFSGDRVRYFDGYVVDVAGGASVIDPGAPVVLTTSTSQASNIITTAGNVTSDNGQTVTERGFVYSTSTSPTTADNKVVVGSGTGTFSGVTSALPGGTYYVRAYATSSAGTTYGSENSITLASVLLNQTVTWSPSVLTATTNVSSLTPSTAATSSGTGTISYAVNSAGTSGCSLSGANPPVISFSSAGNCVVRATAASNSSYNSGYTDVTFSFTAPLTQTVTWSPTNTGALETSATLTPNALASSTGTGTISYSVRSAGQTNCSVNSSTGVLTFTSAGTCVVRATAAANNTYASSSADVTFTIGSATTSLTLNLDTSIGTTVTNAPVSYSSTGLQPGAGWDLVLRSTPQTLASGTVSANGVVLGNHTIPAGLEPGWHSLTLTGTSLHGGTVSTTIWFKIDSASTLQWAQTTQPAELSADPQLAFTSSGVANLLLMSGLLFLCGAGLVFARRVTSK